MDFDYVIIGAGSSGCVLANRLSENPRNSVALLEAGGRDRSLWIHVPIGYFRTIKHPSLNWMYRTEPDPGLNGRSINWPRGKTWGGSSSINGLLHVRGQPQDYDNWRQQGNVGWGWEDVLPLFKRAECWEGGENDLRGGRGPLVVSRSERSWPIVDAWIAAAQEAGYPFNEDYNGADQEGVSYFQLTARNGRRCSSAEAYLKPARKRRNLEIISHLHCSRILFEGKRAVAVEGRTGDRIKAVRARREIILCAGAIGSPHLLMLSGIGPTDQLRSNGIDLVYPNEAVGQNLQDHLQARPVYRVTLPTLNTVSRGIMNKGRIAAEYALRRSGPMAMAASLGTGFFKTRSDLDTPDVQFHIQPFSAEDPTIGVDDFDAFTASVVQLRPQSTGEIRLKSPDPQSHPAIHPNYLATSIDQQTIVEGIRMARRICRQNALADLIIEEQKPGRQIPDSDHDALLEWARNTATTIYHPTGTCRMGTDEKAVVDPRLRVKGVEGLRVADCAIMPTIVSGNTNAPAIMIGEKASELLLGNAGV